MTASLLTRPETPIIPFLSPTWQQTFEDLREAQRLLFLKGWAVETFVDKQGRICLLQALVDATEHSTGDRYVAAVQAVAREIPHDDLRAQSVAVSHCECCGSATGLDGVISKWNDLQREVVAVDRVLFQAIARTGDLCLRGVTAADA